MILRKKFVSAQWLCLALIVTTLRSNTRFYREEQYYRKSAYSHYNNIVAGFNRIGSPLVVNRDISAYMFSPDVETPNPSQLNTPSTRWLTNHTAASTTNHNQPSNTSLSLEDLALIEALWIQDEDLGVTRESLLEYDDSEYETLKHIQDDTAFLKDKPFLEEVDEKEKDDWLTDEFTIDSETGEVLFGVTKAALTPPDFPLPSGFSLEDALKLVEDEDDYLPESVRELNTSELQLDDGYESTELDLSLFGELGVESPPTDEGCSLANHKTNESLVNQLDSLNTGEASPSTSSGYQGSSPSTSSGYQLSSPSTSGGYKPTSSDGGESPTTSSGASSAGSEIERELDTIDSMIQAAQLHHPRSFQVLGNMAPTNDDEFGQFPFPLPEEQEIQRFPRSLEVSTPPKDEVFEVEAQSSTTEPQTLFQLEVASIEFKPLIERKEASPDSSD